MVGCPRGRSWQPPGRSDPVPARAAGPSGVRRPSAARCRLPQPHPFTGLRVVVIGAGNSAKQIAAELAELPVSPSPPAPRSRSPLSASCASQRPAPAWTPRSSTGSLRAHRHSRSSTTAATGPPRPGTGRSGGRCSPARTGPSSCGRTGSDRRSTRSCSPPATAPTCLPRRPRRQFRRRREPTAPGGSRPGVPGLAFVGLEWQHSLSSHSLRGVGRDTVRIARLLAARLARR